MTVTLGVNLMSREGNSQTGHRMNVETHHSITFKLLLFFLWQVIGFLLSFHLFNDRNFVDPRARAHHKEENSSSLVQRLKELMRVWSTLNNKITKTSGKRKDERKYVWKWKTKRWYHSLISYVSYYYFSFFI